MMLSYWIAINSHIAQFLSTIAVINMPEPNSSPHTPTNTSPKVDTLAGSFVSSSSPTGIYDVVVVGAGPIGLLTSSTKKN